jgi:hypothetical protein
MTNMNLIVIEKDTIYNTQLNHKMIISLINNLFRGINTLKRLPLQKPGLCGGYVIIDFNLRMLFFSQSTFGLKELKDDILKFLEKKKWFINYYR